MTYPSNSEGRKIGYVRRHAPGDCVKDQILSLDRAGCSNIIVETSPDNCDDHPKLIRLLLFLGASDTFYISTLDVLPRNTLISMSIISYVLRYNRSIVISDYKMTINSDPHTKLMADMIILVDAFRRDLASNSPPSHQFLKRSCTGLDEALVGIPDIVVNLRPFWSWSTIAHYINGCCPVVCRTNDELFADLAAGRYIDERKLAKIANKLIISGDLPSSVIGKSARFDTTRLPWKRHTMVAAFDLYLPTDEDTVDYMDQALRWHHC